jgi:hypothetical protein
VQADMLRMAQPLRPRPFQEFDLRDGFWPQADCPCHFPSLRSGDRFMGSCWVSRTHPGRGATTRVTLASSAARQERAGEARACRRRAPRGREGGRRVAKEILLVEFGTRSYRGCREGGHVLGRRLGFRSAAGRRRGAKKKRRHQVAATKENAPTRVGARFSTRISLS